MWLQSSTPQNGAYLCARESARRLSKDNGGRGGSVVLMSSAASRLGSPFEYVDYAGSKAALDTLAIGLAKELAQQGVRVNAVRPGLIETEIHASGGQPDRAKRLGAGDRSHSRCLRRPINNDSRERHVVRSTSARDRFSPIEGISPMEAAAASFL